MPRTRILPFVLALVAGGLAFSVLSPPVEGQVRVGATAELQRSIGRHFGLDVSGWGVRAELLGIGPWVPAAAYYRANLGIACIPEAPHCPTEEDRFLLGLGVEKQYGGWISPAASVEAGLVSTSGVRRFTAAGSFAIAVTRWRPLHPRAGIRVEDHEAVGTKAAVTLGLRFVVPPE